MPSLRRVSAANNVIRVIAGVPGRAGSSPDGGPSGASLLYYPRDLAFSPADGTLYIADGTYVVRRLSVLTAQSKMSVVAGIAGQYGYTGDGGNATSATLRYPKYIALSSSALFISDPYSNVVRKVLQPRGAPLSPPPPQPPAPPGVNVAGLLSLFAGSYSGSSYTMQEGRYATDIAFGSVLGLAVSSDGLTLYIADAQVYVVFQVSVATGLVSLYAGKYAQSGYAGDGGAATDALLSSPVAVALGPDGSLYIADGNLVRKVRVSERADACRHIRGRQCNPELRILLRKSPHARRARTATLWQGKTKATPLAPRPCPHAPRPSLPAPHSSHYCCQPCP